MLAAIAYLLIATEALNCCDITLLSTSTSTLRYLRLPGASYTSDTGVKRVLDRVCTFYRAMHFSAKRGIAIACRLSVRPSVCLSVRL